MPSGLFHHEVPLLKRRRDPVEENLAKVQLAEGERDLRPSAPTHQQVKPSFHRDVIRADMSPVERLIDNSISRFAALGGVTIVGGFLTLPPGLGPGPKELECLVIHKVSSGGSSARRGGTFKGNQNGGMQRRLPQWIGRSLLTLQT